MNPAFRFFLLACAAVSAGVQAFAAEPVVRVKARLTAFDGQAMTVRPLSPAKAPDLTVTVTPETRYVGSDPASFSLLKPGDYAGAAVEERDGSLKAQEIFLYAQALRGTGEGRFPEGERLMVNGTVTAVQEATRPRQDNILTLHYRGAMLSGASPGKPVCEGRASPPAFASALACEADAIVAVGPATPVSALTVGDKNLLVPGRTVTVAMTKSDNDKNVALGVVVEKPTQKPQTNP